MTNTINNTQRANRVTINKDGEVMTATFFKTHTKIAVITSEEFTPTATTQTGQREEFRNWAINNTDRYGVDWIPELQQQAWDRKYWKYESDSQVEEDAIELMRWTIEDICKRLKVVSQVTDIRLDSIVANESNLTYVEDGRYTKNGNWASATVSLEVTMVTDGDEETQIIYPIQMVSGQLKKIKLSKDEMSVMVTDGKVA